MTFSYSGKHLKLDYETSHDMALVTGMQVNEETYLKSGFSHLVVDILNFIDVSKRIGLNNVLVRPDRSAMRLVFEELGFRGGDIMGLDTEPAFTAPILDYGRAGGVAPDATIAMEDGRELSAEAVEPGEILLGGGRVYDILRAKVRFSLNTPMGVTSCLTVLISSQGHMPLRDFAVSQVQQNDAGTDLIFFSTSSRVLRANGYWIEDMWGSDANAYSRRISVEQVIAALNQNDGFHA